MTWSWEYWTSREEIAGGAPPSFVKAVEDKAAEIVRAAEVLYLDGTAWQGPNPRSADMRVPGGMFSYTIIIRKERVYVLQITCLDF
ncbi:MULTISPECIES: hypothetical protein [unclassified Kitasatospora]|uniref:hypothetical protein n=1 Tax=unclassified Kitasatospora TaxID=2633591 RepID=UPI00070BF930|nr:MULTISPECIES: hypothetical protein [unclassified Kitasatospora]KQV03336.1 hypothetical protein ASC99_16120 [Kitasatospora sp. Root107]KRB66079.1 hypothetical protein ASE03_31350 [Kitasatospora sp. Root187]